MSFLASITNNSSLQSNLKATVTNTKRLSLQKFMNSEPTADLDAKLTDYFFEADVEKWYEKLKDCTFESDFVKILPKEANAIIANWKKITSEGNTEDDIQPTSEIPKELEPLVKRIDNSIAKHFNSKNVFIKLSSRSPKDSKTILKKATLEYHQILALKENLNKYQTLNDKLCLFSKLMITNSSVTSGKEAVTIMLDSWRVAEDLMSAYDVKTGKDLGYDVNIVVRGWNPKIEPKAEFRGFVIGKRLTCVGQYWHHLYFPELENKKEQIAKDCLQFFNEKLKDSMPVPNAMLDLAWLGPGNIILIEVNPLADGLGSYKASTGLFDYEEDVLQGKKPYEIRICKEVAQKHELRYVMNLEWRKILLDK